MIFRRCTSTKSIDGGSCSERVPCDGALVLDASALALVGGCGEPCEFLMHGGEVTTEDAFRAGYRAGYDDCFGPGREIGANEAWQKFNNGEQR